MFNLFPFLDAALTPYHAAQLAHTALQKNGFVALSPNEHWHLEPQGRYLVDFADGSIFAFTMPKELPKEAHIIGAHTDSPALRVKPAPILTREGLELLNIEVYGGPILSTWFDRPLAVAGLVYTTGKDWAHPQRHVVTFPHTVTIPSLAIHMKREPGEVNPQKELLALWGKVGDQSFNDALAQACNCPPEALLAHELYLVSAEKATIIGNGSLYQSSRIDNLANTYAALNALTDCTPENHIALFTGYQHEEIGSRSRGGAAAPRLTTLLQRLGIDPWAADNLILSADQAHAAHPNYPEKADPVLRPQLGGGPVLKIAANHSYATTPHGEAMIRALCKEQTISLQTFANRADQRGGSTIGPIAEAGSGIEAIDIGAPMLAMHSIRECADLKDQASMQKLMTAFLDA